MASVIIGLLDHKLRSQRAHFKRLLITVVIVPLDDHDHLVVSNFLESSMGYWTPALNFSICRQCILRDPS
jgi:hypothetical protein